MDENWKWIVKFKPPMGRARFIAVSDRLVEWLMMFLHFFGIDSKLVGPVILNVPIRDGGLHE